MINRHSARRWTRLLALAGSLAAVTPAAAQTPIPMEFPSPGTRWIARSVDWFATVARPGRRRPCSGGARLREWLGSRFARHTVRLAGPSGPVVDRREITGPRWEYPADAPALAPNVRYTLQVTSGGLPAQEAWFEVVDAARARAVAGDLTGLEQELGPAVSPTSRAVMRAGLLAREGLLHDARRVVVAALDADRDEPTLHLLLGDLYTRTGLADLAAESFDEAQFLLRK